MKSFPVFAVLLGALAAIAAYIWDATSAPAWCQALQNQTQGCATLADRHNVAAIAAVLLIAGCVTCAVRRW